MTQAIEGLALLFLNLSTFHIFHLVLRHFITYGIKQLSCVGRGFSSIFSLSLPKFSERVVLLACAVVLLESLTILRCTFK